jgi:hypothetical protein
MLASGMSEGDVRAEYPQLTQEDILAAIAYIARASHSSSGRAGVRLKLDENIGRSGVEHMLHWPKK